jgi:hypothetical protein
MVVEVKRPVQRPTPTCFGQETKYPLRAEVVTSILALEKVKLYKAWHLVEMTVA